MQVVWKLLVAAGLLLVAMAMGSDTTVETGFGRVHNLGMQQQQLLLLVFGCVLFLAGIVLYGVAKLKQTAEQERVENAKQEERRAALKGASIALERNVRSTGARVAGLIEGPLFAGDLWGVRLLVGILSAVSLGELGTAYDLGGWLLLGALAASFWRGPAKAVLRRQCLWVGVAGILMAAGIPVLQHAPLSALVEDSEYALKIFGSAAIGAAFLVAWLLMRGGNRAPASRSSLTGALTASTAEKDVQT